MVTVCKAPAVPQLQDARATFRNGVARKSVMSISGRRIYIVVLDISFRALDRKVANGIYDTLLYIASDTRGPRYIAEAGVTVANKAVSDDSGSVSVSGLLLRRREEVLKNINRPEKRGPSPLLPFHARPLSPFLSRIAPFWCHVTNCFYSPVIIFPVEDSHGGERARRREEDDPNAMRKERRHGIEGETESRNKNRINGPSYHARWAIKYRRKYPLAV